MMSQYVCRCCLKENPSQSYRIFDDCMNLWEDLRVCLPASVKYEYNDGLPQTICDLCWQKVELLKNFRCQCLLADKELRNRYADYKNQAVKEVLGLIEKLRQEDMNGWQEEDAFLDGGQKSLNLESNEENSQFSQMSSSLNDLQNCSLDSGIFGNEFSQQSLCGSESLTQLRVDQDNLYEKSTLSAKSNDKDNCTNRKSYRGPFLCKFCDKKFTRNFQLKLHLISVHQIGDGLQYTCQLCNKNFASKHSLTYHQKAVHYHQKPYLCAQCDRQFVLKSQLISHMRTHTGEAKPRIFECQECSKKWPSRSDLRTHMRSHDPNMERPFKCDRCEKSFFTRGHLNSHKLVHTGEKPFACELCKRSYQSVGNLNNHMARRHTNEKLYRDQNSLNTMRTSNKNCIMEALINNKS